MNENTGQSPRLCNNASHNGHETPSNVIDLTRDEATTGSANGVANDDEIRSDLSVYDEDTVVLVLY